MKTLLVLLLLVFVGVADAGGRRKKPMVRSPEECFEMLVKAIDAAKQAGRMLRIESKGCPRIKPRPPYVLASDPRGTLLMLDGEAVALFPGGR